MLSEISQTHICSHSSMEAKKNYLIEERIIIARGQEG
jgi:hypothetical protein